LKRQKGLLLIGGAKRNVGKTTFVCKIIKHFSKSNSIVGLKLKTVIEGDNYFHGKSNNSVFADYLLVEELDGNSSEDTGKMLKAGAKRAFLLRARSEFLTVAFSAFLSEIQEDNLIVCESNSLRNSFQPDLYLFIKDKYSSEMKPSAVQLEEIADKLIFTNGKEHDFDIQQLQIENSVWKLSC